MGNARRIGPGCASALLGKPRMGSAGPTLEASAAMHSIVRRDTGESYQAFLTRLAQASGSATPTREDLARLDKKRIPANVERVVSFEIPEVKRTLMIIGSSPIAVY